MVVMGHFIRQSGLLESGTGVNATLNVFLGSGGRIAVNIFLLIGSWFMVDSQFRPRKAISLYLETAFYCLPITLLMVALGTAGGARNILQGVLPFFGRPVWFASAYISLILLTPFLNLAFQLPKRKQTLLVGALFVLFCVASTIPCFSNIDYIADLSWFCVVYITVGWIKKNDILSALNVNKWISAVLAILIYACLCLAVTVPSLNWVSNYWLDNIRTIPNFLCALGIFIFFMKTDIGTLLPVNFLAKSVFAVYIVHQVPAFREFLWKNICRADQITGLAPIQYGLSILGIAIAIIVTVTAIDFVRQKIFTAVEAKLQKGDR